MTLVPKRLRGRPAGPDHSSGLPLRRDSSMSICHLCVTDKAGKGQAGCSKSAEGPGRAVPGPPLALYLRIQNVTRQMRPFPSGSTVPCRLNKRFHLRSRTPCTHIFFIHPHSPKSKPLRSKEETFGRPAGSELCKGRPGGGRVAPTTERGTDLRALRSTASPVRKRPKPAVLPGMEL